MAGKKIIAICHGGGDFVASDQDGTLSYEGGNAHAIEIDDQIKFEDFQMEVSQMFRFCNINMSFKYFLPPGIGNNKTLISISTDKDLIRMANFYSDSGTVDVYVISRFLVPVIEDEFSHHDFSVARINNGSFGCCPASVIAAAQQWQLKFLRQPDHFYYHGLQQGLLDSRNVIKRVINADDVEEITLVDNATTAVAIVLQRTAWAFSEGLYEKGDAVVMLHYAYGAVKSAIKAYFSRSGGYVIEVQFSFPVESNDEIVSEFKKALEKGKANGRRVRMALIDHVTSMPSVVIPVKELVKICREEDVEQVFVDGAHGIGCVDIDVKEIGADFYTSNLHKWFFCPPSVAFLHCRKLPKRLDLHHPIVSHEYGNGLALESGWVGTRDYSPLLVVPSALEFVDRFENGIDGIKSRNHDSVVAMGAMLAEAWGTRLGCPPDMCASMIMVGLPSNLGIRSDDDALKLRTHLRKGFGVEVPIYYRMQLRDELEPITGYARISHQIYNKVEDYYKLRDSINQLVSEGFACASLSD